MLIYLFLKATQTLWELKLKQSKFLSDAILHKSVQFCAPATLLVILSVLACFQKNNFLAFEGLSDNCFLMFCIHVAQIITQCVRNS